MFRHTFAAATIALFSAHAAFAAEDQKLDIGLYTPTFEENFDTLSVSDYGPGTRWIAHTPWNGDFGDAKFVNPRPNFPFTTKDGILQIEMKRDDSGKWRSGLLASVDKKGNGFSQQYGYFEMRAKFPEGPGVWPAFWLIGLERLQENPKLSAEVDIVEYYGHEPGRYSSSVHVWPIGKGVKKQSTTEHIKVEPGSLTKDYHTYGVALDADKTRFYLDRQLVWEEDTPEGHRQPMFMLVNLGLGAGWPTEDTPNPSFMQVDYVKAFQKK
jgi:beta-glucanase (GH16 family)